MEKIKQLISRINDEIEDSKNYAIMAIEIKHSDPPLSHVYYTLSTEEEKHQAMLHEQVVRIIEQYRKEKGEPPAPMMAVYKYLHKQSIENMEEAKRYQEIYRNM
jgi:citrate synthase